MKLKKILIRLIDVYRCKEAPKVLYRLLAARPSRVNISHREMPSRRKHLAFVRSRPYKCWHLIQTPSGEFAGGVYLSKSDEIGIFLFKEFQKKGYGSEAVSLLMRRYPGVKRFLANVSPANGRSRRFFERLKFKHIQNTYEFSR